MCTALCFNCIVIYVASLFFARIFGLFNNLSIFLIHEFFLVSVLFYYFVFLHKNGGSHFMGKHLHKLLNNFPVKHDFLQLHTTFWARCERHNCMFQSTSPIDSTSNYLQSFLSRRIICSRFARFCVQISFSDKVMNWRKQIFTFKNFRRENSNCSLKHTRAPTNCSLVFSYLQFFFLFFFASLTHTHWSI